MGGWAGWQLLGAYLAAPNDAILLGTVWGSVAYDPVSGTVVDWDMEISGEMLPNPVELSPSMDPPCVVAVTATRTEPHVLGGAVVTTIAFTFQIPVPFAEPGTPITWGELNLSFSGDPAVLAAPPPGVLYLISAISDPESPAQSGLVVYQGPQPGGLKLTGGYPFREGYLVRDAIDNLPRPVRWRGVPIKL